MLNRISLEKSRNGLLRKSFSDLEILIESGEKVDLARLDTAGLTEQQYIILARKLIARYEAEGKKSTAEPSSALQNESK